MKIVIKLVLFGLKIVVYSCEKLNVNDVFLSATCLPVPHPSSVGWLSAKVLSMLLYKSQEG